jgi:hypothetical protein
VTTTEAKVAAAAMTQKSMMTVKLSRSCNQKHRTTTTWRHLQWQHRRQLQWRQLQRSIDRSIVPFAVCRGNKCRDNKRRLTKASEIFTFTSLLLYQVKI